LSGTPTSTTDLSGTLHSSESHHNAAFISSETRKYLNYSLQSYFFPSSFIDPKNLKSLRLFLCRISHKRASFPVKFLFSMKEEMGFS